MRFYILFVGVMLLLLSFTYAQSYTISGLVIYPNGTLVSNASFGLYNFNQGSVSYPVNTSNFSNSSGYTILTFNSSACGGQGEPTMFQLRVFAYNSSGSITHMMPFFEAPGCGMAEMFNNTNITVFPATMIFINATNGTGPTNFSGMLFDDKLSFSVDNFMGSKEGPGGDANLNRSIYVLRDRNYSLVVMKSGVQGPGGELPRPPRTIPISDNNLTNDLDSSGVYALQVNFSETKLHLSGNISFCTNITNTSGLTFHSLRYYPFMNGMVPMFGGGMMGEGAPSFDMDPNTAPYSYTFVSPTGNLSTVYNATLTGSALYSGINYLVEVLARDGADGAAGTTYYGALQNITATTQNISLNMSVCNLAGIFNIDTSNQASNTSRFFINVTNQDDGTPQTHGMINAILNMTNGSGNGPVNIVFMTSPNSSGVAVFPVLRGASMELRFFEGPFAPRKKVLNSSVNQTTLEVATFKPQNPEGQAFSNFQIKFVNNSDNCNVQQPPPECTKFMFNAQQGGPSFNPVMFNQKGSLVNVVLNDTSTGVIFDFVGVDLFASGPPDSSFSSPTDNTPSGPGGSFERATQLGSFAPKIYSYAYVGIPYDDSSVDESQNMSVMLPYLYDEDWNQVWSASSDPNGTAVPSDFTSYNNSLLNQSGGGLVCGNDSTAVCYKNTTTNMIWLKLPHFSGSQVVISGVDLRSAATYPSSSSSTYRKSVSLTKEFNCSDGQLAVTATDSGSAISGLGLKLFDTRDFSYVTGTTDSNGKSLFTIVKNGNYEVDTELTSVYPITILGPFALELCPVIVTVPPAVPEEPPVVTTANETATETVAEPVVPDTKTLALGSLATADSAITVAAKEGKDVSEAKAKLVAANTALTNGNYDEAKKLAEEATQLALNAKAAAQPVSAPVTVATTTAVPAKGGLDLALAVVAVLAVAAVAYYFFIRKK